MKTYTNAFPSKQKEIPMSAITEVILAIRKERKNHSKLNDRASIEMRVRKRERDFHLHGRHINSANIQTIG